MFDDEPIQKSGSVPGNLPTAQAPEDIFSQVELSDTDDEAAASAQPTGALAAGVLKPKSDRLSESNASQSNLGQPPMPLESGPVTRYPTKEPIVSRYIMYLLIAMILLVVLGAGTWFLYTSFVRLPPINVSSQRTPAAPVASSAAVVTTTMDISTSTLSNANRDERVLFGTPIDSDNDGLSDEREKAAGTDPHNWDSDTDGLSDYEEVVIWKTDPKNPDTDADGYSDGVEVKGGYNPVGQGKIFVLPAQK